jgi:hypothetical protein
VSPAVPRSPSTRRRSSPPTARPRARGCSSSAPRPRPWPRSTFRGWSPPASASWWRPPATA